MKLFLVALFGGILGILFLVLGAVAFGFSTAGGIVFGGGKRLRPALVRLCCAALGGSAGFLEPVGDLFIRLLVLTAIPLVFFNLLAGLTGKRLRAPVNPELEPGLRR